MRINHNIAALNTYRQLSGNTAAQGKSIEKLSSGLRINRAGDDAAGLAISEKMRGQIRGLDQATRNAQDGISLIQTAEGALNETHSILQRMRELAVQSANDTSTLSDRREIQKEMNQLIDEIDRIGNNTEFNTQKLLNGSLSGNTSTGDTDTNGVKFHIGANQGQNIELKINQMTTDNMGVKAGSYSVELTVADFESLDFSANGDTTITINGVSVTLDQDYSNDVEGLARHLNDTFQKQMNVSVSASNNKIVFTSESDFTDVTLAGSDAVLITGGAQTATTTQGASTGTLIQSLKVGTPETATTGGVLTQSGADTAITAINNAIETVSAERSKLGAYQNRLEHTINNLGTSSENLTAAESRVRDVDMAKEMMEQTKNSILAQAAQAMLAQANQQPQGVLQLLR